MIANTAFRLDKSNAKLLGVCAGIANRFGWDATFVRIGAVVVTLLGAFPWTLLAYGGAAWYAGRKARVAGAADSLGTARTSTYDLHRDLTDADRRMAEVDAYVATADNRLAREIDQLR